MLYVIIPTFRNFNQTRSFVRDVAVGISSEFILVDDAGTYTVWQQELGRKVHVIKGTGDLWWVGSVNLAISLPLTPLAGIETNNVFVLTLLVCGLARLACSPCLLACSCACLLACVALMGFGGVTWYMMNFHCCLWGCRAVGCGGLTLELWLP